MSSQVLGAGKCVSSVLARCQMPVKLDGHMCQSVE